MSMKFVTYVTLLLIWSGIAIGLATREWWMPAPLQEKLESRNLGLITGVAFVLMFWNLMRLWTMRRPSLENRRLEEEYQRRVGPLAHKDPLPITDPQLRFDDPPTATDSTPKHL